MSLLTPDDVERESDPQHFISALFGYVSGLPDRQFLQYTLSHRFHKIVRRIFFSEIKKRTDLDVDAVDSVAETLLSLIEDGKNRSSDETLIRYLLPHMSMKMQGRTFKSVLRNGTKTTRAYLLRKSSPETTPGIEEAIFAEALRGNEDALVGIVYRWPPITWKARAADLFAAAEQLSWLQRQIVFKSDDPDMFLDRKLIKDPVTELYIRARYRRQATNSLMDSAIQSVINEPVTDSGGDRVGLVAWCLGRYGAIERLKSLPPSYLSMLRDTSEDHSEAYNQST